ncbi:hypothetical protein [Prolixibacter denitrificans]|uniref:Uncharacterized protein n=1 Tax=Prolixibacter denitrificans TaxID=1541063 RepID=A0A2P8C559_9BACT|nr:hypothetical protein [Prolixibacter denitrificans]PSK80101.1 hypothetical protein CLV93_1313 [Prolixibacter denitrificans]GET22495.1 hypothetical protein JCM18694_27410 [Prolixibacter denitrificans]
MSRNKYFSIILTVIWSALWIFAITTYDLLSIIITSFFEILIVLGLISTYRKKHGIKTEFNPDVFPSIKNGDVKLIAEFLDNSTLKNLTIKSKEIRYSFIISSTGELQYPAVIKTPKEIDKKIIIDAINKLGKWNPASKKGKPVDYKFIGGFYLTVLNGKIFSLTPLHDSEKMYENN